MKKSLKAAIVLIVIASALTALFACGQGGEVSGDFMTLVLTDGAEYTQTLEVDLNAMSYNENTGLMNVLESLRLQEKLTYAADSSAYGAFLTAVGGLTQDERAGRYLTVYTSVEKDKGTFEAENHVYTDKNGAEAICYPSGVGVSAMTIQDGCVVVITYVTY